MQIGLIGGIGPAATDYYYCRLINEFSARKKALELTIVHADTPTLLRNLELNEIDAQVEIYNRLTDRLVSAGAECVVVTSISGHFCIDTFKENSPLPVIDMITEVNDVIKARRLSRVGIIGTRTVMQSRFYAGIKTAEIICPRDRMLDEVHNAYISMATLGRVSNEQSAVFDEACEWLLETAEVESIMLGGTDLALVYKDNQIQFPMIDCAAIHVDAIVLNAIS